jgi:hypothetical protein
MSDKEPTPEKFIVTKESLPGLCKKIGGIREVKGRESEVLDLINKVLPEATKLGEHERAVDLYWERYLVGKHLLMQARDDHDLSIPQKFDHAIHGYSLMKKSVIDSQRYIKNNNVDSKTPRMFRFLGDITMIEGKVYPKLYQKAVGYFRKGVELFSKMDDPKERINNLELSGFLAEALILSGKTKEGIDLAKKTFVAYDTGDGQFLKEMNEYQWTVWKSGCATKLCNPLIDRGIEVGDDSIQILGVADKVVNHLSSVSEEYKEKLEIRRMEITSIKGRLKLN